MDQHTLHFDSIVIDAHCDTLGDVLEGTRTLTERSDKGHVDLPRLRDPPCYAATGHAASGGRKPPR